MHLLREPITRSHSRVIVVSSGAVRMPKETGERSSGSNGMGTQCRVSLESLQSALTAGSGVDIATVYGASKFVQLVGAHYWRRQFASRAEVVAVSPGECRGSSLVDRPRDDPQHRAVAAHGVRRKGPTTQRGGRSDR